jgi:hypothetical protein|tara:strand:- start:290 stop:622 length:333 start_codon:yes stop_codon:yes gene_type:complete
MYFTIGFIFAYLLVIVCIALYHLKNLKSRACLATVFDVFSTSYTTSRFENKEDLSFNSYFINKIGRFISLSAYLLLVWFLTIFLYPFIILTLIAYFLLKRTYLKQNKTKQ